MEIHTPVLLRESIENLALKGGETVLDGTFGGGGHSAEICKAIGPSGTLVAIDQDPEAFTRRGAHAIQEMPCKKLFIHGNFRDVLTLLPAHGIQHIDGALLDLGISSYHLETSGRGFSIKRDEPLLMTLGTPDSETAYRLVNQATKENLTDIFTEFGEEQFAWRIAGAIVEARETKAIETSGELAEIITSAVPLWYRHRRIHPATKTFQALRIAVNDELGALKDGLLGIWQMLSPGGRIAVISFHSMEDRIVKQFSRELSAEQKATILTKRPIVPSEEEVSANPRSRSAKLRLFQKNENQPYNK